MFVVITDEIHKKESITETVYYHYDGLGSVVALTNTAGAVVEKYTYDVYGLPTFKDAAGTIIFTSAHDNRFLFTGREYMQAHKLYDYRNRTYSPELGRFLQPDPMGFDAGDVNIYRYCGNNPVNFDDAFGLCKNQWKSLATLMGLTIVVCGGPEEPVGDIVAALQGLSLGAAILMGAQVFSTNNGEPGASPALPDKPWSPENTSKRQSATRQDLGTGNNDPNSNIPDQKEPGKKTENPKPIKEPDGPQHEGEKNVNTKEEHSRIAKGSHGMPRK